MYEITYIQPGVLYSVNGTASDFNYNGLTYSSGDRFRGVFGATAFSTTDSVVYEMVEIRAGGIEFATNAIDLPSSFPETTKISGMAVEFSLNPEEEIVNDVTKITGFAIEFLYYSPYVFSISKFSTKPGTPGQTPGS